MGNEDYRSTLGEYMMRAFSDEWRPPVDIYQTPEGWVIKVELAGICSEDINVSISNRGLIIKGKRRDTFIDHDWKHLSMEISYREFERLIELPEDATLSEISLNYLNGMLLIQVKRMKGETKI